LDCSASVTGFQRSKMRWPLQMSPTTSASAVPGSQGEGQSARSTGLTRLYAPFVGNKLIIVAGHLVSVAHGARRPRNAIFPLIARYHLAALSKCDSV
jgi:hypothetical protein